MQHHRIAGYWPLGYWIVFAAFVLDRARNPGFVLHRERVTYPWADVAGSLALLVVLTAWLVRLTRHPARWSPAWLLEAALFVAALLFLSAPMLVTDLPGHVYAVAWFATVSLIVFLVRSSLGRTATRHAAPRGTKNA